MNFSVKQIGKLNCGSEGFSITLAPEFREGTAGLEGFGHIQVIWWLDGCDNAACRSALTESKPYVNGPEKLGVFATRSPQRPNPIAVSAAKVTYIDRTSGTIGLAWIDAHDNSPVLDIKPYTPSTDRVESPVTPKWCAHWPISTEESGSFDWTNEFNF